MVSDCARAAHQAPTEACHKRIDGKETRAEGKTWHPECFRCVRCGEAIASSFFRVNGELRCHGCQQPAAGASTRAAEAEAEAREELPTCRGCRKAIREEEPSILADKGDRFHERCFVCAECGEALTSYVILQARKYQFQECPYYCEPCADKLEAKEAPEGGTAGSKPCAACGGPCGGRGSVDDAFQLMDGCVLHWKCFQCSVCGKAEQAPADGRMHAVTLLRSKVGALLQGKYVCASCDGVGKKVNGYGDVRREDQRASAATGTTGTLSEEPEPPRDSEDSEATGRFLSLEELKDAAVWKSLGVEASCREQMLSDDDFKSAFGSTKEEFQRLPGWKRTQKKKEMGLF